MGAAESRSRSSSAASTREASQNRGCLGLPASSGFKYDITIAVLGLDNAGKTSTVLALAKEPAVDLAPTVGFSSKKISVRGQKITLYDLGGGPSIRKIWRNYLSEIHGCVYIIDAADQSRIEEAAKELNALCSNHYVGGKPMLILANKSDKEDAFSEYELTEMMNLEDIVNENEIPTKVQASTTMSKDHASLKDGMRWLCMAIASDWSSLNSRVTEESAAVKEKQKAEKRERMARIRREREEREAQENGDDNENDVEDGEGDPFQTLQDHLSNKDKADAAKKSKKKKSSRSDKSETPPTSQLLDKHSSEEPAPTGDGEEISHTPSDSSDTRKNLFTASGDSAFQKPAPSNLSVNRAPSPRPSPFGEGLGSLPARLPPLGGALPPLNGATPLRPLDLLHAEPTKKKKRKKKARINPTGGEIDEAAPSTSNGGLLPVEEEP